MPRKRANATNSAPASAGERSHEQSGQVAIIDARASTAHHRPHPGRLAPEQALAVLDLLDDLRDKIWTRYRGEVQPLLQGFAEHAAGHDDDGSCDDPSF